MSGSLPKAPSCETQSPLLDLIDPIKGVAIAAIVLVHTFRGWFGWQGVHIFIILSGFLLALSLANTHQSSGSHINWFGWGLRRFLRLLPSYWCAVLLGAILIAIFRGSSNQQPYISWQGYLVTWISCLQNFDYRTMFASPNSSLWFIPFVLSCYVVFPFLYQSVFRAGKLKSASFLCIPLIVAALIEFSYRAFAISCLDGNPVAFGHGFLRIPVPVHPLDSLPKDFPFQKWAPFGFSPSRIGELMLGVVGARCYFYFPSAVERFLFGRSAPLIGLSLWLAGNYLVYAGLVGWIFADFLIASGLLLIMPALIRLVSAHCHPFLLGALATLGWLSFPLFLTHLLSGYTVVQLFVRSGSPSPALVISLAILYFILIAALAVLLKFFDDWRLRLCIRAEISRRR